MTQPATRTPKLPGPDHAIAIESNPSRVTISAAGQGVADTHHALILAEASYPPVQYIPRKDVEMTFLARSERTSYCPYKGECAYYSIAGGGERLANVAWSYESPYPAVAAIKDHLAFYADRIDLVQGEREVGV